jgi:hypothetical protein
VVRDDVESRRLDDGQFPPLKAIDQFKPVATADTVNPQIPLIDPPAQPGGGNEGRLFVVIENQGVPALA